MTEVDAPLAFELHVSPLARVRAGTTDDGHPIWEEDKKRRLKLRDVPRGFVPLTGTYREVMEEATRLNAEQADAGRWDYLYNPEVVAR